MSQGAPFGQEQARVEAEAAVFRKLVDHLQNRSDVQNIDLMILADFCRNCLAKWYSAASVERGLEVSYEDARSAVYGMPYSEWKAQHQTPATPEQLAALQARKVS